MLSNWLHFVIALTFISATVCFNIKAHFPASSNSIFPRLRLDESLPKLREFTFCSWVKSYFLTTNCSTVLSYASSKFDNEIVVLVCKQKDKMEITLWRGKDHTNILCTYRWKMSSWFHLCVSWFGFADTANAFINGNKCQEVTFVSDDEVPAGGVLVIGQEQDAFDSKFEHSAAFSGEITDYNLWDEVLTASQISEVSECCGKRREGNVISWMKTPIVPVDGVIISQTQLCSCENVWLKRGRKCSYED